jgi:hypothetical protein
LSCRSRRFQACRDARFGEFPHGLKLAGDARDYMPLLPLAGRRWRRG